MGEREKNAWKMVRKANRGDNGDGSSTCGGLRTRQKSRDGC